MNVRRIRLIRTPTLPALHAAIARRCRQADPRRVRDTVVLLPSRAAAAQLRLTLERLAFESPSSAGVLFLPDLLTRDDWFARLHASLGIEVPLLSPLEREVLLGAAARAAIEAGAVPPFRMRPALVAEMLQFYDALARHQRTLDDFERVVGGDLEPRAEYDRGAERLLRQTRFMVGTYREFDARLEAVGAFDEHRLRGRLLASPVAVSARRVIVAVGDRAVDPAGGLYQADWDLLTRMPGIEEVEVLSTQAILASGWHERLHALLPGLEEASEEPIPRAPILDVPAGEEGARPFTSRDREEELREIARRIKTEARASQRAGEDVALDRTAVVFKRPLPYVYLARTVFGAAGIEFQAADALPLAAEPFAAALALVFDTVAARFSRSTLIALLRSPHFLFRGGGEIPPESLRGEDAPRGISDAAVPLADLAGLSAFDAALADAGYLGDPDRLSTLVEQVTGPARAPALAAHHLVHQLLPLTRKAPVSEHVGVLLAFIREHERLPVHDGSLLARHLRARSAILSALEGLRAASLQFDDPDTSFREVAATLRRWIQSQTFSPRLGQAGVQLMDATAARFADVDALHLAGLVEGDWPEGRGTSIFYPSFLLAQLGWPSESARAAAERAAFADLLRLARRRVSASAFTLEDDSLVEASPLLDELERAGLAVVGRDAPRVTVFTDEALTLATPEEVTIAGAAGEWRRLRLSRSAGSLPQFHGTAAPAAAPGYSVTAIDRYLDCPFKYFAVAVLALPEETSDEEGMSPLERGRFIHEVFHVFFKEWQEAGFGAITVENLDEARLRFEAVASVHLDRLSPADAALERVRTIGSVASPGLGELVLAAEAARPEPVRRRLLEFRFDGEFQIAGPDRSRRVHLRGVVDRADLLVDGRVRIIDYKIGRAPDAKRTVQLPIYMICLPQYLARKGAGNWLPGEALYLAFGEPDPEQVVLGPRVDVGAVLAADAERLLSAIDGIECGHFPPKPSSPRRCATCAYAQVCRKDYVGAD